MIYFTSLINIYCPLTFAGLYYIYFPGDKSGRSEVMPLFNLSKILTTIN